MEEKHIEYSGSDDQAPPPINIINFDSYRINNSWSGSSQLEIVEYEEEEEEDDGGFGLMPSIAEEYDDGEASDLFSYDIERHGSDAVYVVTWSGNEEMSSASMDALIWTIGNRIHESTIVYLVYVFPEIRFIPTPLGMLPISQANTMQKECCLLKERSKRNEYLQRFLSICSSSKVQVETVLIESDMESQAILDLIPILNIRKLVLGATKSNLRKFKSSSKRGGGGTLFQIIQKAPEFCEVKVICEGKEVSLEDQLNTEPPSPSSSAASSAISPSKRVNALKLMPVQRDIADGFVNCSCFKL